MNGLGVVRPNAGGEPIEMIRGLGSGGESGAWHWFGGDEDVLIWPAACIAVFLPLLREDPVGTP